MKKLVGWFVCGGAATVVAEAAGVAYSQGGFVIGVIVFFSTYWWIITDLSTGKTFRNWCYYSE